MGLLLLLDGKSNLRRCLRILTRESPNSLAWVHKAFTSVPCILLQHHFLPNPPSISIPQPHQTICQVGQAVINLSLECLSLPWLKLTQGFPHGAVVENPPANAGETGSSPGPGGSHMPRSNEAHVPQLLKPVSLEPVLPNKRTHCNEKPATKSSPSSPQLEKARVQQRRPNAAKKKKKKKTYPYCKTQLKLFLTLHAFCGGNVPSFVPPLCL